MQDEEKNQEKLGTSEAKFTNILGTALFCVALGLLAYYGLFKILNFFRSLK